MTNSHYPSRCPACGSPAYIGFLVVDCSRYGCKYGPDLSKLVVGGTTSFSWQGPTKLTIIMPSAGGTP